jgi:hypothetical protein
MSHLKKESTVVMCVKSGRTFDLLVGTLWTTTEKLYRNTKELYRSKHQKNLKIILKNIQY